jgi:GR25 family glycosyltransferase involved in LPS biosynthesis
MLKLTILVILVFLILLLILKFNKNNLESVQADKPRKIAKECFLNLYNKFKNINFTNVNIGKKMNNVGCIYVIIMPDRLEYMKEKMNEFGYNYKLVNAVKPGDLSEHDYSVLSTTLNPESKIYNKRTKLPVQISHALCFFDAILNNYKTFIIFEDDININRSSEVINNGIQEFINSDFQIFFMGYCYLNCNQNFNKDRYKYITNVPDKNLVCNHAIVIKTDMIKPFFNELFPVSAHNDELLRDFIIKNNIKTCIPYIPFFIQNAQLGTNNENPENLSTLPYCDIT